MTDALNIVNQITWPGAFLVVGLAFAAAWGTPRILKAAMDVLFGDDPRTKRPKLPKG